MSDPVAVDLALFAFRSGIGGVMLAHGVNHLRGGGKIAGTSRWFASMGMKRPALQAWLASLTEIGAGVLLVAGLFTPLAGAGVVGVMTVAWVINHRKNGFFIFRPGEGWEYVMMLLLCGAVLGAIGPGGWSLDNAFNLRDNLTKWPGLLISALAGGFGALAILALWWRPPGTQVPAE